MTVMTTTATTATTTKRRPNDRGGCVRSRNAGAPEENGPVQTKGVVGPRQMLIIYMRTTVSTTRE